MAVYCCTAVLLVNLCVINRIVFYYFFPYIGDIFNLVDVSVLFLNLSVEGYLYPFACVSEYFCIFLIFSKDYCKYICFCIIVAYCICNLCSFLGKLRCCCSVFTFSCLMGNLYFSYELDCFYQVVGDFYIACILCYVCLNVVCVYFIECCQVCMYSAVLVCSFIGSLVYVLLNFRLFFFRCGRYYCNCIGLVAVCVSKVESEFALIDFVFCLVENTCVAVYCCTAVLLVNLCVINRIVFYYFFPYIGDIFNLVDVSVLFLNLSVEGYLYPFACVSEYFCIFLIFSKDYCKYICFCIIVAYCICNLCSFLGKLRCCCSVFTFSCLMGNLYFSYELDCFYQVVGDFYIACILCYVCLNVVCVYFIECCQVCMYSAVLVCSFIGSLVYVLLDFRLLLGSVLKDYVVCASFFQTEDYYAILCYFFKSYLAFCGYFEGHICCNLLVSFRCNFFMQCICSFYKLEYFRTLIGGCPCMNHFACNIIENHFSILDFCSTKVCLGNLYLELLLVLEFDFR